MWNIFMYMIIISLNFVMAEDFSCEYMVAFLLMYGKMAKMLDLIKVFNCNLGTN